MPSFFWPQCAAQASGCPEPGLLARSGVHSARMQGRRGWWGTGRSGPAPAPGVCGGSQCADSWVRWGLQLLGNRPTPPNALPRPPAGEGVVRSSSVGGTLVRHEVTLGPTLALCFAHSSSLSPLALIVTIPVVHKNSLCVAPQQELHALFPFPFFPPLIPAPQRSHSGCRDSQPEWQLRGNPASHCGAARSFVRRYCSAAAKWSPRASPRPQHPLFRWCALPTLFAELGAHSSRSSLFAPPQDCLASPQPLEMWASLQRLYSELRAEVSRGRLLHSEPQPRAGQSCSFQRLVVALGFC